MIEYRDRTDFAFDLSRANIKQQENVSLGYVVKINILHSLLSTEFLSLVLTY